MGNNQLAGGDEKQTAPKGRSWLRITALAAPLVLFGALASVFMFQLLSGRDTQELPSAFIGKKAPEFALPALAGLNNASGPVPGLSDKDFAGKVTLVNIFASWCAPCRAEHPVLMKMAENEHLDIVGINYKDVGENALRFLGALGNPYKKVGTDVKGRTAIDWGFYGIPETLLVGPDGIIRHKIVGPINHEKFEQLKVEIEKLMP